MFSDVTSHGETLNSHLLAVGVPLVTMVSLKIILSRHAVPIQGQGVPPTPPTPARHNGLRTQKPRFFS
jgi:hypothetical protein